VPPTNLPCRIEFDKNFGTISRQSPIPQPPLPKGGCGIRELLRMKIATVRYKAKEINQVG